MMRKGSKKGLIIIFIIGFIIFGIAAFFIAAHYRGYELSLKAEKDACVYDYLPDGNYGAHKYLRVGNYNGGKVRSYYFFNVSSLPDGWKEVDIIVKFDYGSDIVDVGVNLTYESWDEMTITWNNKPTNSIYRGYILCDGFDFRIPLRLDQIINDGVGVCLYGKGGEEDGYIQGYSKEGALKSNDIALVQLSYEGTNPGIGIPIVIVFGIPGILFLLVLIGLQLNRIAKRRKNLIRKNPYAAEWLNANVNPPIIDVNELPPIIEANAPPPIIDFNQFLSSHRKYKATLEKEINQYITLKLEYGRTHIYVNGKRFIQCIRLILNIPKENIPLYDEIESIDEAAKLYSTHIHQNRIIRDPRVGPWLSGSHGITPEQEFWGHCSNIQAWVEHDYDTRILMSNISFPLLRELAKAGDPKARQVYKEEVACRLESGYPSVVQYLLTQGYLQVFSPEEFQTIIESTDLIKNISTDPKMLSYFLRSCVFKFPSLLEVVLLHILKLPNGKDIIISSIQIDPRLPEFRIMFFLFRNPQFLSTMKTALENLFKRVDEKTGDIILECIKLIETTLERQKSGVTPELFGDRYEVLRKLLFNRMDLGIGEGANHVIPNENVLGDIRKRQSRCRYCRRVIPKGQNVCEWCGHKRDDDEDFFPYPFIRKPPGGGGGAMKGSIAVLAKVKS